MGMLQEYFDYFDKYLFQDDIRWYNRAKKWIDISQKIKVAISNTEFNDTLNTKDILENIIKTESNSILNSIGEYCEQFLFRSNNGLSVIRQQLITHNSRNRIVMKLNDAPILLVEILKENDISKTEYLIRDLVKENTNTVIYRYLRSLFPSLLASPDAPQKLSQRVHIIYSKLGIEFSGNHLEIHKALMNSVVSDDIIKKQIFFWIVSDMLENDLNLKKAAVYYGAPGTGKTYKARNISGQFIDQFRIKIGDKTKNNYHISTVQFHPSYSYEDFIEGIRPSKDKQLKLFNGVFKEFCKKAGKKEIQLFRNKGFIYNEDFKSRKYNFSRIKISELNEEQREILGVTKKLPDGITIAEVIEPAFFIIDEINRAELSRVFGELMYSLEYRGLTGKIKTQYSYLNENENDESVYYWEDGQDWFFIPQNVYIIGTMNNIDRSVDSFDFALRRRFTWEEIHPDFNIVRREIEAPWTNDLANAFEELNRRIEKEDLLGKDYRIGHSYALEVNQIKNKFDNTTEVKEFIWYNSIKPLLEEYLRGLGHEQKAKDKLSEYKNAFGIKEE